MIEEIPSEVELERCNEIASCWRQGDLDSFNPENDFSIIDKLIKSENNDYFENGMMALVEIAKIRPDEAFTFLQKWTLGPVIFLNEIIPNVFSFVARDEPELTLSILKDWSTNENPLIRYTVPTAIADIATSNSPELLEEALKLLDVLANDENVFVRRSVAKALGKVGEFRPDKALLILDKFIYEPRRVIRKYVMQAVRKIESVYKNS